MHDIDTRYHAYCDANSLGLHLNSIHIVNAFISNYRIDPHQPVFASIFNQYENQTNYQKGFYCVQINLLTLHRYAVSLLTVHMKSLCLTTMDRPSIFVRPTPFRAKPICTGLYLHFNSGCFEYSVHVIKQAYA